MGMVCHDGICSRCWGIKYIVIGVVVFVTAWKWPNYIWHVLGVLLVLKGVIKLAMPMGCGHCSEPSKKGKK